MTTLAIFDVNNRSPGGMPVNAALQAIASAAWSRGAVVAMPSGAFKALPPADLMRACRGAWTAVLGNDERTTRVETIVRSIASRLVQPGPVQVSPTALGVLRSFAGIETAATKRRPQ